MDGSRSRSTTTSSAGRGRPEGLVTGDLLVVGVILVGSFTGGTRGRRARIASLELRASGPKEMTDNCFELCLQLKPTTILFLHHCTGTARAPPGPSRPLRTKYVHHHAYSSRRPTGSTHEYIHTHAPHGIYIYTLCSSYICKHVLPASYQREYTYVRDTLAGAVGTTYVRACVRGM